MYNMLKNDSNRNLGLNGMHILCYVTIFYTISHFGKNR